MLEQFLSRHENRFRSRPFLALADVGLANDDVLRQVLHDYFACATTTTMSRYHRPAADVPNGLTIPLWSWDGLQDCLAGLPHHRQRSWFFVAEILPPKTGVL